MKKFLFLIFILTSIISFSQKLTAKNFHRSIKGVWVYDSFCDENWNPKSWTCEHRYTIGDSGSVQSVRTCENMDQPMIEIQSWARYDDKDKIIYARSYDTRWGTGWTNEYKRYWVVAYTKDELRLEVHPASDAQQGTDELSEILRVILKRIE